MRDFYELELQAVSGVRGWSVPETKGGGPSARESHTAVAYSSLGSSKLYIFGGMQGRRLDDLWQLDLGNSVYVLLYFYCFCKFFVFGLIKLSHHDAFPVIRHNVLV